MKRTLIGFFFISKDRQNKRVGGMDRGRNLILINGIKRNEIFGKYSIIYLRRG